MNLLALTMRISMPRRSRMRCRCAGCLASRANATAAFFCAAAAVAASTPSAARDASFFSRSISGAIAGTGVSVCECVCRAASDENGGAERRIERNERRRIY